MRKGEQLPWIVSDGLRERIEPLSPKVERRHRHPGRKRPDDRKALCGTLFVLYTAIPWELLPQELGFGSGMTCRRRLRDRSTTVHVREPPGGPAVIRQRHTLVPSRR
jgi:transposase